MRRTRVIPCLLLRRNGLVKTVRFGAPRYLGDPLNTVRIFSDKSVDELVILDTLAANERRGPILDLLRDIVGEAFVPLGYGGGLRTAKDVEAVLRLGVEKAILCTGAAHEASLVRDVSRNFGSQSTVVCLDVRRTADGRYETWTRGGRDATGRSLLEAAQAMEDAGAGELLIQSIDRDGTMAGYDLDAIRMVTGAVRVPVVAAGGAGSIEHLVAAAAAGATGLAAGSLFVFHGRQRAVLLSYPDGKTLDEALP